MHLNGVFIGLILCAFLRGGVLYGKDFDRISRAELRQELFGISSAKACKKNKACKFLQRHMKRDSKTCSMHPQDVADLGYHFHENFAPKKTMQGTIRYVRFFRGKYKYSVHSGRFGEMVLSARLYIKNLPEFNGREILKFKNKLKRAARIWSENNPYPFLVKFDFALTSSKEEAAVSVNLHREYTRGPYYKRWSTAWSDKTVAHEFAHLLGLDDEYKNTLGGAVTKKCDAASIMCLANKNVLPQAYHYYLIFRRILCH